MMENIELVVLSILASLGFSIVFQIEKKDLPLAALGGGITRILFLIFMAFIPTRIVYVGVTALCAGLYSEVVSGVKHVPATYFLYPTIVPLIPGDLFYFMCVGLISGNVTMFQTNAIQCLLTLVGLSVGFVICSFVSNLMRIRKLAVLAGNVGNEAY